MEIYNLVINNATDEVAGIELRGNGAAQNEVNVYDNIIHMNRSDFGILLIGWEHDNGADLGNPAEHTLHNNVIDIDIDDSDASTGIHLEDSDFCILSCNHINGTYNSSDFNTDPGDGISAETSTDCFFLFNDINFTRRGLLFSGNCLSPDAIERNEFLDEMDYGLYYESDAITGDQVDMGNDWSGGTFDSFGAIHFGNTSGDVLVSEYKMPTAGIPTFDTPNAGPSVPWFTNGNANTSDDECPSPPEEMMMMSQREFSEMENLIAAGEFSLEGTYAESMLRQLQATLYQKIQKADAEMLDETLLTFAEEQSGLPVGQLYSVEAGIANLFNEFTEPFQNDISELMTEIEEIQADLLYTNSQMSMDVMGLEDDKAALLGELAEALASLNEFYDAIHEAAMVDFDELLEYNNSIEPVGRIDENEIKVNHLLLERIIDPQTAWSEEDWDFVEALAYSCPLSDGKPVFLARMLYYEETGIRAISECEAEMRNVKEEPTENNLALTVSPNPAQDIFYLNFSIPEDLSPDLVIKDLVGTTIKSFALSNGKTEHLPVSCDGLQSGVYFILIQDNDHILASHKIIILR